MISITKKLLPYKMSNIVKLYQGNRFNTKTGIFKLIEEGKKDYLAQLVNGTWVFVCFVSCANEIGFYCEHSSIIGILNYIVPFSEIQFIDQ